MKNDERMVVEIWSDIQCPFCYMGKRKFEKALESFPEKDKVEVIWKSFQLNPDLVTDLNTDIHKYLSDIKRIPYDYAKEMNDRVSMAAKELGLEYNFDKAVVANTFKAHCLLHFAKEQGKQNETKERLLRAYFTEGRNMDDIPTLVELAEDAGLNTEGLEKALSTNKYFDDVRMDMYEAQQFDIRGVPFFIFDRKYGISGAQDVSLFADTLNKSFAIWKNKVESGLINVAEGDSCGIDSECC